jgi:hypothetical protein
MLRDVGELDTEKERVELLPTVMVEGEAVKLEIMGAGGGGGARVVKVKSLLLVDWEVELTEVTLKW